MTSATAPISDFPCTLSVSVLAAQFSTPPSLPITDSRVANRSLQVPFPTARLAKTALRAIQVDPELSPLVRRDLSVPDATPDRLQVDYSATTNRMLRVSVNSFMDSLKLVVEVMEHMDGDVILAKATHDATSE